MKKIILILILSFMGCNSALTEPFVIKGIVAAECSSLLKLKSIDEKKTEQIGVSLVQAFTSGYNLRYFEEHNYKKFKDLNVEPISGYNYVIRHCERDPEADLDVILKKYWNSLRWERGRTKKF